MPSSTAGDDLLVCDVVEHVEKVDRAELLNARIGGSSAYTISVRTVPEHLRGTSPAKEQALQLGRRSLRRKNRLRSCRKQTEVQASQKVSQKIAEVSASPTLPPPTSLVLQLHVFITFCHHAECAIAPNHTVV